MTSDPRSCWDPAGATGDPALAHSLVALAVPTAGYCRFQNGESSMNFIIPCMYMYHDISWYSIYRVFSHVFTSGGTRILLNSSSKQLLVCLGMRMMRLTWSSHPFGASFTSSDKRCSLRWTSTCSWWCSKLFSGTIWKSKSWSLDIIWQWFAAKVLEKQRSCEVTFLILAMLFYKAWQQVSERC